MANIYAYLKIVLRNTEAVAKQDPPQFFLALLLVSIPMGYAVNSISLALFVASTLYCFRFRHIHIRCSLILPVLLYLLMALSLLWSVNRGVTSEALFKELPLLLIPFCFMLFPATSINRKPQLIKVFSWAMAAFAVFYLLKAVVRFAITHDANVFFYHELVTLDVNAIHVSAYFAVAFFYFARKNTTPIEIAAAALLFVMIFLLSSKNVIIAFLLLFGIFSVRRSVSTVGARVILLAGFILFIGALALVPNVRDRFSIEYKTAMTSGTVNDDISTPNGKVYNVSIADAWNKETFEPNDFFPGVAFRVYQVRIFTEMLSEDPIFWNGYGLNASYGKIKEKTAQHKLFAGNAQTAGYQNNNFHNQYIQVFCELGVFGLILLIAMLIGTLKNGVRTKDFVHISFAVLMISLFLTESFLWRQRGITFFTAMYCLLNAGRWNLPGKDKDLL